MKKIFLILFLFTLLAGTNNLMAQGSKGKMAAGAGLGVTFPMGDLGDAMDYAVPLLASFQYAVIPQLSLEADIYYDIYVVSDFNYSSYQYGISARYWLKKNAYNGVYLGGGFARTHVEMEIEFLTYNFVTGFETSTIKTKDDYNTLVLKGGYVMPLNGILLDFGARYDAIEMKDFGSQPITLYAAAFFNF